MLYSNHPSGSVFVPCFKSSTGEATIVEIKTADLPVTLSMTSSGVNGLDTGSVAADKFYCIRMIAKADGGDPALLATLNAGTPTIPTAYQGGVMSDILWGVSCCVDYDSSGADDEIHPFMQTGSGVCQYQSGGEGYQGAGIHALNNGDAIASTAVDISHLAPAPVAYTRQESLGSVRVYVRGHNNNSISRNGYVYWSADGRTDADANDDDALEIMYQFQKLDNAAGEGGRDESVTIEFPLAVSKTDHTLPGSPYTTTHTGTLANFLQYKWQGAASCQMNIWVQGWKLNG
tara:strand:+ start:574 stop:1440 length:867 start_codon:yes stop_codon:yes gene_type:complete